MKDVTTVLKDEHKNILKVIKSLLEECESLENGEEINRKFFKDAIEFIQGYADSYHHAKEEDILFKELCSDDVKMHCNPTGQMLLEHNLGRGYVKSLEDGIEKNNTVEITKNARAYAELLTDHIYKEDNILYPMAEEALNEKQKSIINQKFDRADNKLKDKKERYILLIKDITSTK